MRHEISQLLPKTHIKPYVSSINAKSTHLAKKINWGAGARIETARRRDPGKINQMAESIGRIGARIETQIPFPIAEFSQSILARAFISHYSVYCIYIYYSSPIIRDCIITDNSGNSTGGGIFADADQNTGYPAPTIENCLIKNNSATDEAGGIKFHYSKGKIINSTIVNNSGGSIGTGGVMASAQPIEIINSIIYNNESTQINDSQSSGIYSEIIYSDIQGGWDGEGNIDSDPLFVDGSNDDYHLSNNSPCIAAGLDTSTVPSIDIDGNPRPNPAGSSPDMGAFEHENATPTDIVPPTVSSISSSSGSGIYGIGDTVIISINFSESVIFTDSLIVTLETGTNDRTLSFVNVSNASTISGYYIVQAGDESADLAVKTLGLSSGTLRDAVGNIMTDYSIPTGQNLSDLHGITIDGLVPDDFTAGNITTAGGTVVAGYWNNGNNELSIVIPVFFRPSKYIW